ncbi:hypothetical protein P4479_05105 [Brevibacillus agri]|nr:hypothetical protein [Brevibacillus agri]
MDIARRRHRGRNFVGYVANAMNQGDKEALAAYKKMEQARNKDSKFFSK